MTVASIRGQIAAAIRLIVQLQRMSDGKRKVTSVAEVTGLEGDATAGRDGPAAARSRRG
jgi:pilus assembly protein CpaF